MAVRIRLTQFCRQGLARRPKTEPLPEHYVWYEVFPNPAVVLGAVSPGDQMEAAISYSSGSTWDLSIADLTSGNSASGPLTYSGPGDSAEWIEEVPEAAESSAAVSRQFRYGRIHEISATAADPSAAAVAPIDMVDPVGNIIAETGPISSSAFTVTYVHEPTTTSIAGRTHRRRQREAP